MGKMYYTEEEAAGKLAVPVEELVNYVRDQKLRLFKDGARNMYMAGEVDALAPESIEEVEEVELSPVEDTTAPQVQEGDAAEKSDAKSDTVAGAEEFSIFDEADLGADAADPMAKTQVTPGLTEQMVQGAGGGSGLLDLTREGDDTSLGEVIDRIDLEEPGDQESAVGTPFAEPAGVVAGAGAGAGEAAVVVPEVAEVIDASSGLFGGLTLACAVVIMFLAAMAVAVGAVPAYVAVFKKNLVVVLVGAVALVAVFGLVGLFVGRSIAGRRQAMQGMGQ